MIRVTLLRQGDRLTGCRARGHSGWAEAGSDIICAAVSILTCTCVNALESVCGVVPENVEVGEEEGILNFDLPEAAPEKDQKAQVLMRALEQGLKDLAEQYPKYVKLSIK